MKFLSLQRILSEEEKYSLSFRREKEEEEKKRV